MISWIAPSLTTSVESSIFIDNSHPSPVNASRGTLEFLENVCYSEDEFNGSVLHSSFPHIRFAPILLPASVLPAYAGPVQAWHLGCAA